MSPDAVRLWNSQWVCIEHYETRQPLDFLETKEDGQTDIPWGRGQDAHYDSQFIQPATADSYVVCGFVEDGTDSFGGPNETAVTVTPGGTVTQDHVTPSYTQSAGGYVQFTGACATRGAGNRVVTRG